jgi:RNA polymerase primary sigma factor
MIVSVYKYRGLNNPSTSTQTNSNAKLIIKRLEGQEKRWKVNLGKFNDLIKTESPPYDEQFLFLSVNDMQDFFEEVLLAEHNWLNSRLRLTKANSKLVAFIANQYKGSFLSFEDLVQEGHIGLLKAVDRFDPHLGFQFSTYAGYWIRQSISRALSRLERVVRIPCGQVANINKIFRAKEELSSKTGMEVSVKELAAYTKFSEDEINILFSIAQSPLSLESFDDDEEDSSFSPIDYLEQQTFNHSMNNIAEAELERLLENALKILNPRESTIIQHHFGIQDDNEMTLQDIGAELQLTRERVRQIQVKALNKIKLCYGHQLSSFL